MNQDTKQPVDLFSATAIVAASMIGAGVFTTSGFSLGSLESAGLVVAAWMVGGLIAICGAICYGALVQRFTDSGGEYLFLSKTVHPAAGMMAGWVSLFAGFTGALAFAATTFAEYLSPWLSNEPLADGTKPAIACLIVVLAAMSHSFRVKAGARIQDVVVTIKFVLIAAFILVAAYALFFGDVTSIAADTETLPQESQDSQPLLKSPAPWIGIRFATQLIWISLSYSGFQAAVYVAAEVKNANRNVPRAMVGGTLLVTLIYVILNAIFVFGTPARDIVFQEQVATLAAQAIGGTTFQWFTRGVILLCLLTSVSALTLTGPRVYSKMADDGFMPGFLRFKEGSAPKFSIGLQAALAMIVIWISTLPSLLGYLGFTLSISAALTASTIFFDSRLRERTPWFPIPAVIYVGGTLLTAILSAYDKPVQAIVALGTLIFGAIVYIAMPSGRLDSKPDGEV